ncbi:MAG: hypothetical protein ACE5FU_03640 [Nitrospinota bacterium]
MDENSSTSNPQDQKEKKLTTPEIRPEGIGNQNEMNDSVENPGGENGGEKIFARPEQDAVKPKSGGVLLFFSLLISLISLFLVVFLFSNSIQLKSQIDQMETQAQFSKKRAEMFASETAQWRSGVFSTLEGLGQRLHIAETIVEEEKKERRRAEFQKILLGMKELSRLSDDGTRARIAEAVNIIEGLSPSAQAKPDLNLEFFKKQPGIIPPKIKEKEILNENEKMETPLHLSFPPPNVTGVAPGSSQ